MDFNHDGGGVRVGYYDPFDLYGKFSEELSKKLPLTNLHWKESKDKQLKSIDVLRLTFVQDIPNSSSTSSSIDFSDEQNDQFYHNLILQSQNNNVPYVQVMLIKCLNMDDYKSKVRPLIREWLKQKITGNIIPTGWLLVLVADGSIDEEPTVFNKSTNVYNKIKLDFEESHCIKLKAEYKSTLEYNENWNSLITSFKLTLLDSFTERLKLYKKQLQSLDKRKIINPIFKIVLQESTAKIFQDMTLYTESLIEYDKLLKKFNKLVHDKILEVPTGLESPDMDWGSFINNKLFHANLNLEKLLFDKKLTKFQFYCYNFLKQSSLLISLSTTASSPTFRTLHIIELLRRLRIFTSNLLNLCDNNLELISQVSEFNFIIIDEYLQNEAVLKTIQYNLGKPEIQKHAELLEFIGELKLCQREQLIKIGEYFNYKIEGVIADVDLHNDNISNKHDESSQQKLFQVTYAPLVEPLRSQSNFEDKFVELTQQVVENFNMANIRPRSIDILSTEIAMVFYNNGLYEKASNILSSCFQFYKLQGWDYISCHLLKIYIECLEKIVNENDHPDSNSERDEAGEVGKTHTLLCSYLDLLSTKSCTSREISLLANKITKLSSSLKESDAGLIYPLETLFDFKINKFIESEDVNIYNLKVTLTSHFKFKTPDLKVNSISLELINMQDPDESIILKNSDIQALSVGQNSNKFKLTTTEIIEDDFKLSKLVVSIGKLNLHKDFSKDNERVKLFPVISTAPSEKNKHPKNNFWCDLSIPSKRYLNDDSMLLTINNGDSALNDLNIQFWCGNTSSNLELVETKTTCFSKTDNGKSIDIESCKDDDGNIVFNIKNGIAENEVLEVYVPYLINPVPGSNDDENQYVLKIKAKLKYKQNGQCHQYHFKKDIDTSLSIAVTVQDIFKSCTLFSNFSIGTSDSKLPIKIIDVDFHSSSSDSNYNISTCSNSLLKKSDNMIAYGEQPAKFFYKIEKKDDNFDKEDETFLLTIKYRDLKDEALYIIKDEFKKMIEDHEKDNHSYNFRKFALKSVTLFENLLSIRLNLYSIEQLIRIDNNLNQLVDSILRKFFEWHDGGAKNGGDQEDEKFVQEFAQILLNFFKKFSIKNGYQVSILEKEKYFESLNKILKINVPVPLVRIIHKLEFKILQTRSHYIVGEPIQLELYINSTTSWSGKPPLEPLISKDDESSISPPIAEIKSPNPGLKPGASAMSGSVSPSVSSVPSSPVLQQKQQNRTVSDGDSSDLYHNDMSTSTIDLNAVNEKIDKKIDNIKKKKKVMFESTSKNRKKNKQSCLSFEIDLQISDNWLISGKKKFLYKVTPSAFSSNKHNFELEEPVNLILIPLKIGKIPLPKIDIRLLNEDEDRDEDEEAGDKPEGEEEIEHDLGDEFTMEIDYKNNFETLTIVSELDKINFEF
ncbi:hypothetical protein PACTADRAFT_185119 [Pachysolen tannophilus NRRL Y-2460]|uniref:Trafficking protein particle complex subunit 11 domain-containing protein n=1 Tax=Pachysolen tannophilus NRRL Y-2460 TaxID=669874 RepID=A0A1E4U319_PACTA|nr:hypothetical protein PACTADRAFT_185119 [Pachysolen tannophilus NRRL Y-2460]